MSVSRSSLRYHPRNSLKLFEVKEKQRIDIKKTQTSAGKLRLQKDISELNVPRSCSIQFTNGKDDPMNFQVSIVPDEGFYLGDTFLFFFQVSPIYPHEAPKVKCITKVYHPNIDLEGNVCLNILREDWKPVFDINTIIYGLYHLLKEPKNEDPLNHDTAVLSRETPYKFESTSRFKSGFEKKMTTHMENLPEDLVSNVLSRLPVRELLKCKCVCKSWLSQITDTRFVSNYSLNRNNLNCCDSQEGNLLIIRRVLALDIETWVSIHYLNGNKPKRIFSSEASYSFDRCKYRDQHWSEIMGPCNGIYFLEGKPRVMINPSLRQSKQLTTSRETYSHGGYTGFGFDPKTNDYKVVVLKYLWLEETNIQKDTSELYSLNSNSWRKLDDVILPLSFRIWGTSRVYTFVNNCFHWWGYVEESGIKEDIVLSFDMVNELLRKIKVPKIHSSSLECFTTLSPFLDSSTICAINYRLGEIDKVFDIWVMNDYWDEQSWIKQYSVGPVLGLSKFIGFYESNHFLWANNYGSLVLYNLGSEQTTCLDVSGSPEITRAARYMESIVSLIRENAK